MKKAALCLSAALFLLSINSFSQVIKDSSLINSLKAGKWAIQFEIGSFVNPNFFEAVMFCLKPQLSRHIAVRGGLSYDFGSDDGEVSSGLNRLPDESRYQTLTAVGLFQYYFNPSDIFVFYLGTGPIYKYKDDKSNYIDTYSSGNEDTYGLYWSRKRWSAGGVALIGVEWFLHPRVSVLGEYWVTLTYGKDEQTETEKLISVYNNFVRVQRKNYNIIEFQFNIAKVGLSVYF